MPSSFRSTEVATPQLNGEQIAQLSVLVAQYITSQREKYSPGAARLSPQQAIAMGGFFPSELLDQARLLVLKGERVAIPDFYRMLQDMGFNNLPDQSTMGAITFSDVVVSHGAFSDGLLFHELVHVEQYRQLGVRRFSELYVGGFLASWPRLWPEGKKSKPALCDPPLYLNRLNR
jgi:hypothetical protein